MQRQNRSNTNFCCCTNAAFGDEGDKSCDKQLFTGIICIEAVKSNLNRNIEDVIFVAQEGTMNRMWNNE